MKKLNLIICFLIVGRIAFAQNANSISNETNVIKHSIHTDIGTLMFWGFYSINYETTLIQKPQKNILRFRTGFLYTFDTNSYGVPLCLTALFGKNNKYFELSVGVVPRILKDYEESGFGFSGFLYNQYSIYPLLDFGFRYEPNNGKLSYRIKLGSTGLGVGVGYAF